MTRKSRSRQSFRRRPPSIAPRACVLIVCEGEKTEPNYFRGMARHLRLLAVEVKVVGDLSGSAPINVVNSALDLRAERQREAPGSQIHTEYDEVWCVIDVEAPQQHESLNRAYDKALSNDLKLAISNPAFEYWYLLHFEKTSALMLSNKDLRHSLKKYCPDYRKNDERFFEVVWPKTDKAIENARAVIREKHYGKDLRECNPSTHVHKLVLFLKQIAIRPPTA